MLLLLRSLLRIAQNCFTQCKKEHIVQASRGREGWGCAEMTTEKKPITIKKYANRRLYNTGSSSYVTLEDLGKMVKDGDDFVVIDAKTSEDITRSVLAQIIFEQEAKEGQSMLPIAFLRQLIRFYGDSMQMVVPSFLEMSLSRFTEDQQKMREQIQTTFTAGGLPGNQMFEALEEQTRKNMQMFSQAISVFTPFIPAAPVAEDVAVSEKSTSAQGGDLDELKKQIADMQRKLEGLARGS
jgi:polyhydroxyalkanoate synthesis repressor PhaR